MKLFTICNVTTGECRGGMVINDADVDSQVLGPGESILVGVQGHHIEDKAVVTAGKPQIVKRDAADIASRRPASVALDVADVLVEVLKKKGINVTAAELNDAKQSVFQKTKDAKA